MMTTPMVIDPTNCADIKARLEEKLAAYHLATSGGGIRSVQDSDTSRIEYQSPNAERLMRDIQLLQAMYTACLAGTAPAVMTKPINYLF
jgi:hypothetical protein